MLAIVIEDLHGYQWSKVFKYSWLNRPDVVIFKISKEMKEKRLNGPSKLICNFVIQSRLVDTSLLRTPRYSGQELKSQRIRITENYSRYYGLPVNGHQMVVPKVSVIVGVADRIHAWKHTIEEHWK